MQGLERTTVPPKELQARYIEALQKLAKLPKELAEYHGNQADTEQMRIYVQFYDRQLAEGLLE